MDVFPWLSSEASKEGGTKTKSAQQLICFPMAPLAAVPSCCQLHGNGST